MINAIQKKKEINKYLCHSFSDSGINVDVDSKLTTAEYIGVKVDDYYNAILPMIAPKSVDFIITVDCSCNSYVLYILEFKNLKKPKSLHINEIHEKFDTTVNDFIKSRFKDIFLNDRFKYKKVLLYLVSDIYNEVGKTSHHVRDSLKVDTNLAAKLYKIKGIITSIQYDIPPNPLIKKYT